MSGDVGNALFAASENPAPALGNTPSVSIVVLAFIAFLLIVAALGTFVVLALPGFA